MVYLPLLTREPPMLSCYFCCYYYILPAYTNMVEVGRRFVVIFIHLLSLLV